MNLTIYKVLKLAKADEGKLWVQVQKLNKKNIETDPCWKFQFLLDSLY